MGLRHIIYLLLMVVLALSSRAYAQRGDAGLDSIDQNVVEAEISPKWSGSAQLIETIETLVNSARLKTAQRIGVSFVDLKTGQPVLTHRSTERFHPASNIKLLTSAAALNVLGARHRWMTILGTDRTENTHMNHLMIRGGGDPSLSIGDVAEWVLELKSMGFNQIDGDLIVDATLFESFGLPPGFEEKEQDGAYRAAVSSINLNWNHIMISISDRGDTRGHVAVFPPNDYVKIVNKTQVKPKVRRPIAVSQEVLKTKQKILVKGELKRGKSRRFRRRIGSPLRFFTAAVRAQLALSKIRFTGKVRFELIKNIPKTLINHTSEPLSHILKAINSWSNNLSAEVVVLSMAQKQKLKTTFSNGLDIVRAFASTHLQWSGFTLTNGSGLFGSTRVSPDQMTRLLAYMYVHRDQYPDYLVSLAAAGLDGTMKKRLVDLKGAEVYAKTGTLDGVSGLSGYIRLNRGDMVAFSILQNDFKASARPVRALQDDIVRAFVKTKIQMETD